MIKHCLECGKEFTTNRSSRKYCGKTCSNKVITREREAPKAKIIPKIVWSCGGGVQSSAIAALIIKGRLPKPDFAVMVDVGYEKSSSWENVHNVLQPALAGVGVDLIIIKTTDYRDNYLFDRTGHFVLPGYRLREDGTRSRLNTHCSGGWKMKVVMKWLRQQGVQAARGWVGISADERRRMRPSPYKWYTWEYPLIKLGMDRVACHIAIHDMGWKRVLHSSCYICPQQNDEQWRYTKLHYPNDWQRVVTIDEQIRIKDPNLFLHSSCMPIEDWIEANPGLGELTCGGGCEYCV